MTFKEMDRKIRDARNPAVIFVHPTNFEVLVGNYFLFNIQRFIRDGFFPWTGDCRCYSNPNVGLEEIWIIKKTEEGTNDV